MSGQSEKMQSELFIVLALVFFLVAVQVIKEGYNEEEIDPTKIKVSGEKAYLTQRDFEEKLEVYQDSLRILKQQQSVAREALIRANGYESESKYNYEFFEELNAAQKNQEAAPIFFLSEKDEAFKFDTGSYELSAEYRKALGQKILEIDEEASKNSKYNAIEIIGHTDGEPVGIRPGRTFDRNLEPVLESLESESKDLTTSINPNSNYDLGMLRALAVANFIKRFSLRRNSGRARQNEEGRTYLREIEYWFPYSAGPLIRENGQLITADVVKLDIKTSVESRRRIEIRLFEYKPNGNN